MAAGGPPPVRYSSTILCTRLRLSVKLQLPCPAAGATPGSYGVTCIEYDVEALPAMDALTPSGSGAAATDSSRWVLGFTTAALRVVTYRSAGVVALGSVASRDPPARSEHAPATRAAVSSAAIEMRLCK